ncbi:MAG: hypothetical protein ACFFDF_16135 [Candidatus Odinarchaeota archaeon]
MRWDEKIRNIGCQSEMKVAKKIKKVIPKNYNVETNGSRKGADLYITYDNSGIGLKGEVKTAKEMFLHTWNDKKNNKKISNPRRGMFNIEPHQLDVDFYAFVIRFVDDSLGYIENGDYEIFYALGSEVKRYLLQQTLNCNNYKLCIDKLHLELNVTMDFLEIFNEIKRKINISAWWKQFQYLRNKIDKFDQEEIVDFEIEIIECEYKDSCSKSSEFCFNEYKDVCSTRTIIKLSETLKNQKAKEVDCSE